MSTILDNVERRKKQLANDSVLTGQSVAAAIAAMSQGVKSDAWEAFMTVYARDDDGTIDQAKLARLTGRDNTLGDPIMDRKRAYVIGNCICADTTNSRLAYGVASIDDGVNGVTCDRFLQCPETEAAKKKARAAAKRAAKKARAKKGGVKKAAKNSPKKK